MGCGCKKNQTENTEAQIANKQIAEEQLKRKSKNLLSSITMDQKLNVKKE